MDDNTVKWIYTILCISIISCIVPFILVFHEYPISYKTESWGQIGDYIGGLMNPLVAILNAFIAIQIARAVNNLSAKQVKFQVDAQKEMVRIQMLHEILKEFRKNILSVHTEIENSLKANDYKKFDLSLTAAHNVIDGFKKYHQDMFSFPAGIALSIDTDYNELIAYRDTGAFDVSVLDKAIVKSKIEIDLMLSLLYKSIIEDAKNPEPKPLTQEILNEWTTKLGLTQER